MQILDSSKPATGTPLDLLYAVIRNSVNTLRSLFSGFIVFSQPTTGQLCHVQIEGPNGTLKSYDGTWSDIAEKTDDFRLKGVTHTQDNVIDLDSENKSFIDLGGTAPVSQVVTNFTNGKNGEEIFCRDDGQQTKSIQNNANIKLQGAANYALNDGDVVSMVNKDGVWYETGRVDWGIV